MKAKGNQKRRDLGGTNRGPGCRLGGFGNAARSNHPHTAAKSKQRHKADRRRQALDEARKLFERIGGSTHHRASSQEAKQKMQTFTPVSTREEQHLACKLLKRSSMSHPACHYRPSKAL